MKKFLIAYGFIPPITEERIQQMAKFDLVDTGFEIGIDVQRIKAINPNCKVIGYMDAQMVNPKDVWYPEVTIHEDWFLHDINGNRLVNKTYGGEYVNEANAEWQTYFANRVLTHCNTYGFDGVFADDVNVFTEWHRNNLFTVDGSLVPDDIITDSYARMMSFVKAIKSKIGSKLMIINTATMNLCDFADGYMIEDFLNPTWFTDHISNRLFAKPKKIKVLHSQTADVNLSFTAALLPDHVYWGYATSYWFPNDPNLGYPPQMDLDIGNPRGSYYQVQENLLGRDYDKAKVFVNFSDTETYTVDVEGISYTLAPHSGVIVPWEAPPTPPIIQILATVGIGATLLWFITKWDG